MGLQKRRMTIFKVTVIIMSLIILVAFVWAQLINKTNSGKIGAYTTTVASARGDILDRNGEPLVTNRQGNSIVINAATFPDSKHQQERNAELLSLIKLCEANNIKYINNLPVNVAGSGKYAFDKGEKAEAYIKWLKSPDILNLNNYATAENCMDALIKEYKLEKYSKEDAAKLASVYLEMKKDNFSKSNPYTFAEDVPTEFITVIMENKTYYRGIENVVEPYRTYVDGTIAPHILGRTGPIDEETYKKKKKEQLEKLKGASGRDEVDKLNRDAYRIDDEYGNSGIEAAMEEYLRGSRGEKTVTLDTNGNIEEKYTVDPVQGDAVILTIDKNLQQVAQKALKERIDTLNVNSARKAAGAVVVQDVRTGEILACATYPSYDNKDWDEKYSEWANDEQAPLWNRAVSSIYEPGSTFKPCVAIAALEEGVIDGGYTWNCTGAYTHYKDHTFYCYNHTAHGTNTVIGAIDKSCNCFFYETGRRLGIDKIDEWATNFGFGQKTGVEIPEAVGLVSSPKERKARGGVWYPGDTITTAIGESDNQFTLLQMCNFVSTVANGGVRYKPHFVKEVKSSDYKKTILNKNPEVILDLKLNQKNLDLVKQGMWKVGMEGFCKSAFSGLPVEAAAKTGTSDVVKIVNGRAVEGTNGFLISFAPYKDPEIAVAVAVETASGNATAVIAADIYDYYFSAKVLQPTQQYDTLLS